MRYFALLILLFHCLTSDVSAAPGVNNKSVLKVYTKSHDKRLPCIDLKISYPQIRGVIDKRLERKINVSLKRHYYTDDYERSLRDYRDDYPSCKQYGRWILASEGFDVTALTRRLLSIAVVYYSYDGGAHGTTYASVSNFDLQTGKLLRLRDVLQGDYLALIKKEFQKAAIEGFDNIDREKITDSALSFWIEQQPEKGDPKIHIFYSENGVIELSNGGWTVLHFHRPQDVIHLSLSSIENLISKAGPLGFSADR